MMAICPQCKQDSHVYFRTKDYNRKISRDVFYYYLCPSCKLIFLSPIPEDLGKYYPNNYYLIPSSINDLAKTAEHERYKLDITRQFASGGPLLEIGPAYGSFLYLAKQSGFEAEAIEMDTNCCTFIRENIGAKVLQSDDPSEALKSIKIDYNVITMWHVIEHLPDPWKTLAAISRKLHPGGILVIAAPNPDAFQFRVMGRFWPHVDAPRHLSLIPQSLLASKMQSLGFKAVWSTTIDQGTLGWNMFGWMYLFSNVTSLCYIKTGLAIIGRIVSRLLSPIERMNRLGSAYTIIFQKE